MFKSIAEYLIRIDEDRFCEEVQLHTEGFEGELGQMNQQVLDKCDQLVSGLFSQGYAYILGTFHKQFTDAVLMLESEGGKEVLREGMKVGGEENVLYSFYLCYE